jgi:hypothetical protein
MKSAHLIATMALTTVLALPALAAAERRGDHASGHAFAATPAQLVVTNDTRARFIRTHADRRDWKSRHRGGDRGRHGHKLSHRNRHDWRPSYPRYGAYGAYRGSAPSVIFRFRLYDHQDYAPRRW